MNSYDSDYFFIDKDEDNPRLPFLQPDDATAARNYYYEPPEPGSAPYVFVNGWRDEFREDGIVETVADILFDGAGMALRAPVHARLLALDLPELHFHPAVYIDGAGRSHADYWYVLLSYFDCWDRERSVVGETSLEFDDERLYNVFSYALDAALLDRTPLRERLLFRMGATVDGLLTCHRSVAAVLKSANACGAVFQPITDY